VFDDIVNSNRSYAESFHLAGLDPSAARGLAVITCMDSRIEPLQMLGLAPGDAKILRNAGARVTDDVLRTLVLAVHLLGVNRVCVVPHTGCRLIGASNEELHTTIWERRGIDATAWDFLPIDDQFETLRVDIERIRACDLLPSDLAVAGFIYDVDTGQLHPTIA
jgi:carbonic anhydrase